MTRVCNVREPLTAREGTSHRTEERDNENDDRYIDKRSRRRFKLVGCDTTNRLGGGVYKIT